MMQTNAEKHAEKVQARLARSVVPKTVCYMAPAVLNGYVDTPSPDGHILSIVCPVGGTVVSVLASFEWVDKKASVEVTAKVQSGKLIKGFTVTSDVNSCDFTVDLPVSRGDLLILSTLGWDKIKHVAVSAVVKLESKDCLKIFERPEDEGI